MHESDFLNFILSMLAVTNPVGNLAIFLSLTHDKTSHEQKILGLRTTIAVAVVLLLMTWVGTVVLSFFGISLPAFETAGGIVIILIGISMLRPKKSHTSQASEEDQSLHKESIAVVPMAIPIIAGPGAMTAVVIMAKHYPGVISGMEISGAIFIISLIIGCILFFSSAIQRVLGTTGLKITTRVMGMILIAIAIGMMATGLKELFPILARLK